MTDLTVPLVEISFARMHETQLLAALEAGDSEQAEKAGTPATGPA